LAELTVVQKFNQGVPAMAVHHCRGPFLFLWRLSRWLSGDKQKRKEEKPQEHIRIIIILMFFWLEGKDR